MAGVHSFIGSRTRSIAAALSILAALSSPQRPAFAQHSPDPAVFLTVDCVLPAQVRKMGRMLTYLAQRRAVRTSASDCEIRGGEFVAADRADYRTAFQVWLPLAQAGDAKAQTYVGEIFEKGLGRERDYAAAALWYERAVAQGYMAAKINLAHLLNEGLGVPPDSARAGRLLIEASGIDARLTNAVAIDDGEMAALKLDRDTLSKALRQQQAELAALQQSSAADRQALAATRAQLDAAQRAKAGDSVLESRLGAAEQALAGRILERDRALEAARKADEEAAKRTLLAERRVGELQQELAQANARLSAAAPASEAERTAASAALARTVAGLKNAEAMLLAARTDAARDRSAMAARSQHLEASLAATQAERDKLKTESEAQRKRIDIQAAELKAQESRLAQSEQRLAVLQAQILPSGNEPVIELIEPTLLATRGRGLVSVNSGIAKRAIFGHVKSRDAIGLLTVNGQRQTLDDAGLFQFDLPLSEQTTQVEIVAIDRQGRKGRLDFDVRREITTSPLADAPPPAPPAMKLAIGPQYALLIGNSRYAKLAGLKTPVADVDEIGRILREKYGFKVTILHDATRYEMLSALNALRTKLTQKDDLLVYYAGHGHKVSVDGRERGYWLPVDAEENNPANWISTLDITDMLASMEVHKVLLISDSCYSGLLTRGLVRLVDTKSESARETYLKTMLQQKSRNVLTSGSDLPVLDGGGGTHSVFAKSLARVLNENKGTLQGQDLAQAVQQTVSIAAQSMNFDQKPQYGPLQLAGHEGGDYILQPTDKPL
ncbi:caspase family protein [Novosphingobium sp. MMS21-SN21R]|uniref:caspase family protein n=1 Tax=Novosphingobium sp. MMS21-SN21R TaxID=2969298 RepID=UPI0028856C96|nr:caspase family protein [Novosphingobium sp. MMS21-SN21R]MDT0506962.1 caspase family protein [Novosphingobium sp. MMS21-SN21R]